MRKNSGKKKPSITAIFVVLTLLIASLLILFRHEQGPVFGLLIVAACFVFPITAQMMFLYIGLLVKKLFENGRARANSRKLRRYRTKYITEFRLDVPGFGSHSFEKDSKTGAVKASFFSDYGIPHDWESTVVNIDITEKQLDRALETLVYIYGSRESIIQDFRLSTVNHLIANDPDIAQDSSHTEKYVDENMYVSEIEVCSDAHGNINAVLNGRFDSPDDLIENFDPSYTVSAGRKA